MTKRKQGRPKNPRKIINGVEHKQCSVPGCNVWTVNERGLCDHHYDQYKRDYYQRNKSAILAKARAKNKKRCAGNSKPDRTTARKSNALFHTLKMSYRISGVKETRKLSHEDIDRAVDAFLKSGGKITWIDPGSSKISDHVDWEDINDFLTS